MGIEVQFSVGPKDADKTRRTLEFVPRLHEYIVVDGFVAGYVYTVTWEIYEVPYVIITVGYWSEKDRDYRPGFVVDCRETVT